MYYTFIYKKSSQDYLYIKVECAKLAWGLGFDLFRVRRVARSRIWVVGGLGLGKG